MKLEVGKTYITKDMSELVHIHEIKSKCEPSDFSFSGVFIKGKTRWNYHQEGNFAWDRTPHPYDLVELNKLMKLFYLL